MSHITSRWSRFRTTDDSIPVTPYEAGVFIQNARLHLTGYGFHDTFDARMILLNAHEEVNRTFFDREVA